MLVRCTESPRPCSKAVLRRPVRTGVALGRSEMQATRVTYQVVTTTIQETEMGLPLVTESVLWGRWTLKVMG